MENQVQFDLGGGGQEFDRSLGGVRARNRRNGQSIARRPRSRIRSDGRVDAGSHGAGRAKLRLSRGFPLGLAQQHHPHKFSLGFI
jgi:hypothetical protein